MKKVVALALSLVLVFEAKPAKSQVQLAPLAPVLCATGAGCLFVGIVVVGGIAYAAWQYKHQKILTYPQTGSIFRIDESDDFEEEYWTNAFPAQNKRQAQRRCIAYASHEGHRFIEVVQTRDGLWKCQLRR